MMAGSGERMMCRQLYKRVNIVSSALPKSTGISSHNVYLQCCNHLQLILSQTSAEAWEVSQATDHPRYTSSLFSTAMLPTMSSFNGITNIVPMATKLTICTKPVFLSQLFLSFQEVNLFMTRVPVKHLSNWHSLKACQFRPNPRRIV